MSAKTRFWIVALDILAGFVALCLELAATVVYSSVYSLRDIRVFSLVTAVPFFLAGVVRGASAPKSALLKGLLISLGGAVPVILMRVTWAMFGANGYVQFFVVFSLLFAILGVGTRHLLTRGRLKAAFLLASLSFAAVTLALIAGVPALMASWNSDHVNRPAPSFSFGTPGGKTVTVTDLRGLVVVLAFWATWCGPTQREFPDLQKTYEQYKGNPNVTFYAVGGPWGGDTIEKEAAFASRMRLNFPLVFDSDVPRQAFGVRVLPALIILDGAGHIRLIHNDYDGSEHLARHISSEIEALLSN
jgi:peroxiredoxin